MDKKFKGTIINSLRKLSYSYPARNNAKKQQKVAPATFECQHCGIWIYEGSKDLEKHKELISLKKKIPKNGIIKDKSNIDHIDPIIPLEGFQKKTWDWHEYIENMFCKEEGFQVLCKSCHKKKTDKENQIRLKNRQKNLTNTQKTSKVKK